MNVIALVVLIGVVAPFVVYSMPAVVGADHSFVVLSGSMEPEISPGDVVIVSETTQSQIERGDVITFMRSEAEVPTTHRVIEVNQREDGVAYTTKGDANEDPDPQAVRPVQVIGEVTYTIPVIGYVVRFANTQTGFMLLIGLPLGLLIANEAWSILRAGNGEISTEESDGGAADSAAPTAPAVTTAESVDADAVAGESATTGSTTTESGDETPSTYTVTRSDLKLSMSILFVFAVYATWIALQETTGVTVTAAVGAGAGVVICGAVYYAAGSSGGSSPPAQTGSDGPGDDGGDGGGHAGDDDGGVVSDTGSDEDGSAGAQVGRETPAVADSSPHESDSLLPTTAGGPVVDSVDSAESADSADSVDSTVGGHGNEATNGNGVMGGTDEADSTGQTAGTDEADSTAQTSQTDDTDGEENR